MKRARETAQVEASGGNVYADLRLKKPKEMLAKARLVDCIAEAIAARQLTQAKAAELMGLDQPKVSALLKGMFKGFSTDRLYRCLTDLGQDVEIRIRPSQGGRGQVRVLERA